MINYYSLHNYLGIKSPRPDLNRQPADYKSAAPPIVLPGHWDSLFKVFSAFQGVHMVLSSHYQESFSSAKLGLEPKVSTAKSGELAYYSIPLKELAVRFLIL